MACPVQKASPSSGKRSMKASKMLIIISVSSCGTGRTYTMLTAGGKSPKQLDLTHPMTPYPCLYAGGGRRAHALALEKQPSSAR